MPVTASPGLSECSQPAAGFAVSFRGARAALHRGDAHLPEQRLERVQRASENPENTSGVSIGVMVGTRAGHGSLRARGNHSDPAVSPGISMSAARWAGILSGVRASAGRDLSKS